MGSYLTKIRGEEVETPSKENIVKRIEDPRSPTDYISRTPIEVADKVPKESIRQLAFANALKEQNKTVYESSPIYSRPEKYEIKKLKYPLSAASDSVPILQADESSMFNISAIEKENAK